MLILSSWFSVIWKPIVEHCLILSNYFHFDLFKLQHNINSDRAGCENFSRKCNKYKNIEFLCWNYSLQKVDNTIIFVMIFSYLNKCHVLCLKSLLPWCCNGYMTMKILENMLFTWLCLKGKEKQSTHRLLVAPLKNLDCCNVSTFEGFFVLLLSWMYTLSAFFGMWHL